MTASGENHAHTRYETPFHKDSVVLDGSSQCTALEQGSYQLRWKKDAPQKKKESCLNLPVTGTYFLNYYTPSPHNLEGINLQNIHSK